MGPRQKQQTAIKPQDSLWFASAVQSRTGRSPAQSRDNVSDLDCF